MGGNNSLVHDEEDMVEPGFGTLAQRFKERQNRQSRSERQSREKKPSKDAPDHYMSPNSTRIAQLKERNKRYPDHLKSSYPIETQGRSPDRMDTYSDAKSKEPETQQNKELAQPLQRRQIERAGNA